MVFFFYYVVNDVISFINSLAIENGMVVRAIAVWSVWRMSRTVAYTAQKRQGIHVNGGRAKVKSRGPNAEGNQMSQFWIDCLAMENTETKWYGSPLSYPPLTQHKEKQIPFQIECHIANPANKNGMCCVHT